MTVFLDAIDPAAISAVLSFTADPGTSFAIFDRFSGQTFETSLDLPPAYASTLSSYVLATSTDPGKEVDHAELWVLGDASPAFSVEVPDYSGSGDPSKALALAFASLAVAVAG